MTISETELKEALSTFMTKDLLWDTADLKKGLRR